jgi:cell division protein FtsQ
MVRSGGPLIPDDELASPVGASPSLRPGVSRGAAAEEEPDSRLLDLEVEEQSPFLRAQKRVAVRRGPLPRKAANRLKLALMGLAVVVVAGGLLLALYRYGSHSWRFRLESSDNVEIAGTDHVSRAQVMEVMGGDIGRNVFFVPLAERRKQVEEIPWVESAAVMRFLPNRMKVEIRERTPVAFVQIGSKVSLIDAHGMVMDLPAGNADSYSFPVITGMGVAEPLSTRAARMKIFMRLMHDLDAEDTHHSQDINEVDLSDPEDVKVTAADPKGEVLIHLGSSDFLDRYKVFLAHIQDWRRQFQRVNSVDLRYDRQVIVNPDEGPRPAKPAASRAGKAPAHR